MKLPVNSKIITCQAFPNKTHFLGAKRCKRGKIKKKTRGMLFRSSINKWNERFLRNFNFSLFDSRNLLGFGEKDWRFQSKNNQRNVSLLIIKGILSLKMQENANRPNLVSYNAFLKANH